ncbi:MAG: hypothetical protein EOM67_01600 [Spirochaetia bacterium]|nr:hypothetical protein [Spirochaetia bacterium]
MIKTLELNKHLDDLYNELVKESGRLHEATGEEAMPIVKNIEDLNAKIDKVLEESKEERKKMGEEFDLIDQCEKADITKLSPISHIELRLRKAELQLAEIRTVLTPVLLAAESGKQHVEDIKESLIKDIRDVEYMVRSALGEIESSVKEKLEKKIDVEKLKKDIVSRVSEKLLDRISGTEEDYD